MKQTIFLFATVLFTTFSAQAANLSPEHKIAVDTMVRQVVQKNLLGSDRYAKQQTKMLEAMVNRNIKAPYTSIKATYLECDHGLNGKDQCKMGVLDATDDGTESLSEIDVEIEKGEVVSASMTVIAG